MAATLRFIAICLVSVDLARAFSLVSRPPLYREFAPTSTLYQAVDQEALPTDDTFSSSSSSSYQVSIAYCTGCRWGLRSFWMAQELLTTFEDDQSFEAVSLLPSSTSGQFTVTCHHHGNNSDVVLWDRTEQGGFPEMKQLKQLLRDEVEPTRYLGHSDTEERKLHKDEPVDVNSDPAPPSSSSISFVLPKLYNAPSPSISIAYCTGCKWLYRAAWYAQECLQTFSDELLSVSLVPTRPPVKGGTFSIFLNDKLLWDRAEQGEFPDIKSIKQRLRDELNPSKDLGHVDGASCNSRGWMMMKRKKLGECLESCSYKTILFDVLVCISL